MLWSKSKVSETERTWWCSPFYLNLRLKQLHCDHEAWRWTINSTLNMTNGSRKGWNRSRDNGNDRNTYFASKYWRNQRAVYIHGGNNNGSKCLRLSLRFNEFIDLREILRGASAVKLGKCARFCVSWQSVYRPNVPVSIRMRGRASRIPVSRVITSNGCSFHDRNQQVDNSEVRDEWSWQCKKRSHGWVEKLSDGTGFLYWNTTVNLIGWWCGIFGFLNFV